MLEILMITFTIYFILKVYIAFMQIGYVGDERKKSAIILSGAKYIKAGSYAISVQKLSIIEAVVEYVMFIYWINHGLVWLDNAIPSDIGSMYKSVLYVLSFLGIGMIVSLPLDIYKTFWLDKEYDFTKITPSLYILDSFKSLGLTIIVGGGVVAGLTWIIESFVDWWIWGFVFIMIIIIAINALYPTIMALMYNKFSKLEDTELADKIENLLDSVGFKSSGVFQVDASKRDSRLNAYFGGLGSTKRVVLFDTLIKKLSHEELIAVLGHELGHFKNRDLIKNIFLMGLLMLGMFGLVGNIPNEFFTALGLSKEPYTLIAIFMLISSVFSFFIMPIMSYFSRANEYKADEFGSDRGGASNLVSALLKLVDENLSFPKSHPIFVFFYYSHPPLVERLKRLGHHIPE
jgi:STE24 endopeptidase